MAHKLWHTGLGRDLAHWDEHPDYPVSDWQYDVANGDTRLGYLDWCAQQPPYPDDMGE